MPTKRPRRRRPIRGAFLLPSAFTTGNLFLGFLAIVQGLDSHFVNAALLIFVAGVLDGLDGWLARQTGSESDFGKQYDSLADFATFGVAPALLAYLWGLNELGRIGWLVPFFFLVCSAARLARFNIQKKEGQSRFFVGLPMPAAGGMLASVLFIAPDNSWKGWLNLLLLGVVIALALLMVSTFRYLNPQPFARRRVWSYRIVLLTAGVVLLVAYHPPAFFVSVGSLYTCSGPVGWLRSRIAARRSSEPSQRSAVWRDR